MHFSVFEDARAAAKCEDFAKMPAILTQNMENLCNIFRKIFLLHKISPKSKSITNDALRCQLSFATLFVQFWECAVQNFPRDIFRIFGDSHGSLLGQSGAGIISSNLAQGRLSRLSAISLALVLFFAACRTGLDA